MLGVPFKIPAASCRIMVGFVHDYGGVVLCRICARFLEDSYKMPTIFMHADYWILVGSLNIIVGFPKDA